MTIKFGTLKTGYGMSLQVGPSLPGVGCNSPSANYKDVAKAVDRTLIPDAHYPESHQDPPGSQG